MSARLVDRDHELETFPVGATKRFVVTDRVDTPFPYPCNVTGTLLGEGDTVDEAIADAVHRGNAASVGHMVDDARLHHLLANGAA